MSNLPPSSIKFTLLATVIVLTGAGSLAALWPTAIRLVHQESAELVQEGNAASGGEAETDYLLATVLDSTNTSAYLKLAKSQIDAGTPDSALITLGRAGKGSEAEQLKVRTLIELGRTSDAANEASQLAASGSPEADLSLAILVYTAAGRNSDATALVSRLSSPEAVQRATRAQASTITLAAELYATGLLNSSSALLVKQPTSYERNLLLGSIRYDRPTIANLAEAVDYLTSAIALNPARTEARSLLVNVYRKQGDTSAADSQAALINKLYSGRL